MSLNMYALERMANEINEKRLSDARNYRLWQKLRKCAPKRTK